MAQKASPEEMKAAIKSELDVTFKTLAVLDKLGVVPDGLDPKLLRFLEHASSCDITVGLVCLAANNSEKR